MKHSDGAVHAGAIRRVRPEAAAGLCVALLLLATAPACRNAEPDSALAPEASAASAPATLPAPAAESFATPPIPAAPWLDPVAAAAIAAEGRPPRSTPEVSEPERPATSGEAPAGPHFTEVTDRAGITFRYTIGDYAYDNILESSGSGVTWFDADGDGDLDLFFANGTYIEDVSDPKGRVFAGSMDAFYLNDGGGQFHDATAASGLGDPTWSMGAMAADFDGDGDVDLFLANYGPNRLYRNEGNGTFTDVAPALGLVGPEKLNGFLEWSVGGAWHDADRDGDLDLFVCNFLAFDPYYLHPGKEWEMPDPKEYRGQASMLYLQGADGRFTDVTEAAGLFRPDSKCMGVTVLDFDGDGWLDIFQANDHQPSFLFRSRGDGTYEEVGLAAGVAVNADGIGTGHMHGTVGDIDGDGLLDLFVADLSYGSMYRQTGPLLFSERIDASGLRRLLDGLGQWGAVLQDLDDDGDLDLFTTNGVAHILVEQPPMLAVNDGRGRFRDARRTAGAYFRELRSGRGAAWADYDNDGDLDLVVSHLDFRARPALLQNDTPGRGHWLGVVLVPARRSTALGARLLLEAGGRRQASVLQPYSSYLSQSDPRVHFGLGQAQRVDRLTVTWPSSGRTEVWENLTVDRYVTLEEGSGRSRPDP